jgi:hypothetical protein
VLNWPILTTIRQAAEYVERNLYPSQRVGAAVHAVLGDSDEEFMIIGRARASDDWVAGMQAAVEARKIKMTSQNHVPFEFLIERVHWALWEGLGTPEIHRVAKSWRAE